MIKASELRIGNYLDRNGLVEVRTINQSSVRIYDHYNKISLMTTFPIHSFKGIELTPEWIINLGFKDEGNEIYSKGVADTSYCLQSRSKAGFTDGGYFMGIRFDDWEPDSKTITNFAYEVKFVHQLQNLFFALTGRELELKK